MKPWYRTETPTAKGGKGSAEAQFLLTPAPRKAVALPYIGDAGGNESFSELFLLAQRGQCLAESFDFSEPGALPCFGAQHGPADAGFPELDE